MNCGDLMAEDTNAVVEESLFDEFKEHSISEFLGKTGTCSVTVVD